jgi:hypothetical protein
MGVDGALASSSTLTPFLLSAPILPPQGTPLLTSRHLPMRTPSPSPSKRLLSVTDRAFSAEEDAQLLSRQRQRPGMFKAIARSMNPPRHKHEVKARIRHLFVALRVSFRELT